MLYWTQEGQSQALAENGVREIVVGIIGHDEEPEVQLGPVPINELATALGKQGQLVNEKDLPEDIYWTLQAENHRARTGEIMTVEDYRKKYG